MLAVLTWLGVAGAGLTSPWPAVLLALLLALRSALLLRLVPLALLLRPGPHLLEELLVLLRVGGGGAAGAVVLREAAASPARPAPRRGAPSRPAEARTTLRCRAPGRAARSRPRPPSAGCGCRLPASLGHVGQGEDPDREDHDRHEQLELDHGGSFADAAPACLWLIRVVRHSGGWRTGSPRRSTRPRAPASCRGWLAGGRRTTGRSRSAAARPTPSRGRWTRCCGCWRCARATGSSTSAPAPAGRPRCSRT